MSQFGSFNNKDSRGNFQQKQSTVVAKKAKNQKANRQPQSDKR